MHVSYQDANSDSTLAQYVQSIMHRVLVTRRAMKLNLTHHALVYATSLDSRLVAEPTIFEALGSQNA